MEACIHLSFRAFFFGEDKSSISVHIYSIGYFHFYHQSGTLCTTKFFLVLPLAESKELRMAKSSSSDAQALIRSLRSAYSATPTSLKVISFFLYFFLITSSFS